MVGDAGRLLRRRVLRRAVGAVRGLTPTQRRAERALVHLHRHDIECVALAPLAAAKTDAQRAIVVHAASGVIVFQSHVEASAVARFAGRSQVRVVHRGTATGWALTATFLDERGVDCFEVTDLRLPAQAAARTVQHTLARLRAGLGVGATGVGTRCAAGRASTSAGCSCAAARRASASPCRASAASRGRSAGASAPALTPGSSVRCRASAATSGERPQQRSREPSGKMRACHSQG